MGVVPRRAAGARLDRQAARLRPEPTVPADSGDPRRPVRQLRHAVYRGNSALRRGGLRCALHQSAGQHELRRGVRQPHPSRLSRQRLRRPHVGRGRGHRAGLRRREPAVRDGWQRWGRAECVDRGAHRPVPCRRGAEAGDQLVQLRAVCRRSCVFLQVLVPRATLGALGALHGPLPHLLCGQRDHANDAHHG